MHVSRPVAMKLKEKKREKKKNTVGDILASPLRKKSGDMKGGSKISKNQEGRGWEPFSCDGVDSHH
jgi:phage pi2 protein 07